MGPAVAILMSACATPAMDSGGLSPSPSHDVATGSSPPALQPSGTSTRPVVAAVDGMGGVVATVERVGAVWPAGTSRSSRPLDPQAATVATSATRATAVHRRAAGRAHRCGPWASVADGSGDIAGRG